MTFSDPAAIELLVMDVDGVMTAGDAVFLENAGLSYHFNVQDGSALKYWMRNGGKSAIITGRESEAVTRRAENLGIDYVYQKQIRKLQPFAKVLDESGVDAANVCCVGDDLPDLPMLLNCGFPVAVANAVPEVKQRAAYVTRHSGGNGAIREVVELIMRAKGLWSGVVDRYIDQRLPVKSP